MSRAFVKEDVDPPERSGRVRSASGLPPGATNYMTLAGATRLRQKLQKLRGAKKNAEPIAGLEQVLDSATIVEAPTDAGKEISFGARLTVRDATGQLTTYRIVGVDELDLYADAVSWISPIGKALLAAELGQKVVLPQIGQIDIVDVEYPNE
jgi:hypothetical protein